MKIGPEEVDRIAALARLELRPDERERLAADLTSILDYVDQLASFPRVADAGGSAAGSLREDEPRPPLQSGVIEGNAPHFRDGFFVVPKILGGD